MFVHLRQRGAEFGMRFVERRTSANSHMSLLAGEFARENGRYHEYHEAMFKAYFQDGRDIGDTEVVLDVAKACGLDTPSLTTALDDRRHQPLLDEATRLARMHHITAIPAFVVDEGPPIIGAQPLHVFRQILAGTGQTGLP